MLKFHIQEVYIPFDLTITKDSLKLVIITNNLEYKMICSEYQETNIQFQSNSNFELILFMDEEIISNELQNFSFLEATALNERYDDWIKFKLLKEKIRKFCKDQKKLQDLCIKLRISGVKIEDNSKNYLSELYFTPKIIKSNQNVIEINTCDTTKTQKLFQDYFPCPYINVISNIEFFYKSIGWITQKVELNGIIDQKSIYRSNNGEILKVFGNSSIDLNKSINENEENSLSMIVLALIAKQEWANFMNEELNLIKEVSDLQISGSDTLKSAKWLIETEHIVELGKIDQEIKDIKEDIQKNVYILAETCEDNLKLEEKNKILHQELEKISEENNKISSIGTVNQIKNNKNWLKELEDSYLSREMLKQKINISKNEYLHFMDNISKDIDSDNTEIQELTEISMRLEQEIKEIEKENLELSYKSLKNISNTNANAHKTYKNTKKTINDTDLKGILQDYIKNTKNIKLDLHRNSILLVNKIEKSSKIYKQQSINAKKKIETTNKIIISSQSQLNTLQNENKQLMSQLKKHSIIKIPSISTSLADILIKEPQNISNIYWNLYNYSKERNYYKTKAESLLNEKILQQENKQKHDIDLKLNSVIIGDRIHYALLEFQNLHRDDFILNFIRKNYGIYEYDNKLIQLRLHNEKLVVKVGSGFLPIFEFILNKKKRSESLKKPLKMHSSKENYIKLRDKIK